MLGVRKRFGFKRTLRGIEINYLRTQKIQENSVKNLLIAVLRLKKSFVLFSSICIELDLTRIHLPAGEV